MKKIILILFLYPLAMSFAQNDSTNNSSGRFFVTPALRYNFSGIGIKLNLGYDISRYFSIILSSGYMTRVTNSHSDVQQSIWDYNAKDYMETTSFYAKYTNQFIPLDLALRYNFEVFGLNSYVFYQAGWNILFNAGDYNVILITKYKNSDQIIETNSGNAADIYNYSKKTSSDFGEGIGVGALIPLSEILKIDISCSYIRTYPSILSLGAGLNIVIK